MKEERNMTKKEIIKEIGLDNYYGVKQEKANKTMLQQSKNTLEVALNTWRANPTAQTREFIGRVLSGIFKHNCPVNEIK